MKEPGVERSRDRVRDDRELRELWNALEQLAQPINEDALREDPTETSAGNGPSTKAIRRVITPVTAQAFQVQLLTAQRPGAVRDMKWADVDLDTGWWTPWPRHEERQVPSRAADR